MLFSPYLMYSYTMGSRATLGRATDQEGAVSDDYVTMREAQEILGVSNFTVWQMVKDGRLTAYRSETDRRKKLIRRADLSALQQPQVMGEATDDAKKAAA